MAATGANKPQAWASPLAALLGTCVLLYYRGALLLKPHMELDAAYDTPPQPPPPGPGCGAAGPHPATHAGGCIRAIFAALSGEG